MEQVSRHSFLLRGREQVEGFRTKFGDRILASRAAFISWVNRMPLMEWQPLLIQPGTEEDTIGMLCYLYVVGDINIVFSEDMQFIRRCPSSEEEFWRWARRNEPKRRYRHRK
jgi:hypothetical protein